MLTDSPTWIIDPIDGTKSYIQNLPYFAVSVAMTFKKELVLGIVYNPILNELYTARLGNGSFLNGKQIKCSTVENVSFCYTYTKFVYYQNVNYIFSVYS